MDLNLFGDPQTFQRYLKGEISFEDLQRIQQEKAAQSQSSTQPTITSESTSAGGAEGQSQSNVQSTSTCASTSVAVAEGLQTLSLTPLTPVDPLSLTSLGRQAMEKDVEVTGFIKGSGQVQVKQEPVDHSFYGASGVEGLRIGDENDGNGDNDDDDEEEDDDDDDDVILVDSASTFKYLTGEMTFEEYSSLLERQPVKDEPVEIPDVAMYENIETMQSDEQAKEATESTNVPKTGTTASVHKSKRGRKKLKTRLPRNLQGLMGEANVRYARGEIEDAVKMCMEVIRVAPNAAEPFQTMAMIYEEKGDQEKCLQYSLIAAHLSTSRDPEEWIKVAEMCVELGKLDQAIIAYSQAIKLDHDNVSLWWARSDVYDKMGEKRKAMDGYQTILNLLPRENGEKFFQITRDLAKNFHKAEEISKALAAMQSAFDNHPKYGTLEDVNLFLELLITQKEYKKALEAMIKHCGVVLIFQDGKEIKATENGGAMELPKDDQQPVRCFVPQDFHIDLHTKLIVCLIHLQYFKCAKNEGESMLQENPDEMGDLYLDIAEAYMEVGQYVEAQCFLSHLVKAQNYNKFAAVWLKYGECLNATGQLQHAVQAYKKVVELAPSHLGARVSLSTLQQQLGRPEEALEALRHSSPKEVEEDTPSVDPRLLLHRSSLLYSQGKLDEFVICARDILYSHIKHVMRKEVVNTILTYRSLKHRLEAIRHVHGTELEKQILRGPLQLKESNIDTNDLWELYLKLTNVLVDTKRFQDFEDMAVAALVCPQFMSDPDKAVEADFICLTACIMNRNGHYGYPFIRELCLKNLHSSRAWNLFGQVISMSQNTRHNRFCLRLTFKHQDHYALNILNGHTALVAATYKHALGEYVAALKQSPHDPLLCLCVGLTFIHMGCQKFADKKHSLVIQGCAFLNQYLESRGECQESFYNLGRGMHQLNLLHAAVYYYEKALEFPPAITDDPDGIFDLTKEIAYNLLLIYKGSGNAELAGLLLQKYLVI